MNIREQRHDLQRRMLISVLLVGTLACCGKFDQNRQREKMAPLAIQRWPGEGVPVIAWTGPSDSLAVYRYPGDESSVRHIAAEKNQPLQWDKSLMIVKEPGQMKILEDCIIDGFIYDSLDDGQLKGGSARQINFCTGTILEVICYAAEGFYIFRQQDRYLELDGTDQRLKILSQPQTRWWVRITKDGEPIGWVPVDEDRITVIDRRF